MPREKHFSPCPRRKYLIQRLKEWCCLQTPKTQGFWVLNPKLDGWDFNPRRAWQPQETIEPITIVGITLDAILWWTLKSSQIFKRIMLRFLLNFLKKLTRPVKIRPGPIIVRPISIGEAIIQTIPIELRRLISTELQPIAMRVDGIGQNRLLLFIPVDCYAWIPIWDIQILESEYSDIFYLSYT